jgi:hypothetical protein
MAWMLLSRGGSVEVLSRFIVDMARPEHTGKKIPVLRCLGCIVDEGKEDELLDLLSNATQGAPPSLADAVMEILHDAESSFMSDTVGLAKSFSERQAKFVMASSEQGREVDRESDAGVSASHNQTNVRPIGDPNERERGQEAPEFPPKLEEKVGRSIEGALAESSSRRVRSGISVQTTSTPAVREAGSAEYPDHPPLPRNAIYGVGHLDGEAPLTQATASPKELESGLLDTKTASDSISDVPKLKDDGLAVAKVTSLYTIPRKPLLNRQFSREGGAPDEVRPVSHAAEPLHLKSITELQLTTAQSLPHQLPVGHVFGIPLEELGARQGRSVPQIVLDCISVLEQSMFHLSDIYQHPPEPMLVNKLRDFMETGELLDLSPRGLAT